MYIFRFLPVEEIIQKRTRQYCFQICVGILEYERSFVVR